MEAQKAHDLLPAIQRFRKARVVQFKGLRENQWCRCQIKSRCYPSGQEKIDVPAQSGRVNSVFLRLFVILRSSTDWIIPTHIREFTNLNASIFQKHPPRHTEIMIYQIISASCGPFNIILCLHIKFTAMVSFLACHYMLEFSRPLPQALSSLILSSIPKYQHLPDGFRYRLNSDASQIVSFIL